MVPAQAYSFAALQVAAPTVSKEAVVVMPEILASTDREVEPTAAEVGSPTGQRVWCREQ